MSKLIPLLESLFMNNGGTADHWRACLKVIQNKPQEAKSFISFIKPKLKDINSDVQIIALDLVDYLMDEGNMPFHTQIASIDFLTNLISLLKTRDSPDVQVKILYLIKKWGQRFESQKDIIPNFYQTYTTLRNNGVVFPETIDSNYTKYVKGAYNSGLNTGNRPSTSSNRYESEFTGEYVDRSSSSGAHRSKQIGSSSKTNHYEQVNLDLNPENYERKYRKFVSEISILLDNINLANEMIDNANPNKQVDESLRTILSNLRDLENNLVRAIQNQIKNEKLLGICLGINDDLNRTFARYDALKGHQKPEPFITCFLVEYASSNTYSETKESYREKTNKNNEVERSQPKETNVNLIDMFDFGASPNTTNVNTSTSNVNKPQILTKTETKPKVEDLNDIFSNINLSSTANQNTNNPIPKVLEPEVIPSSSKGGFNIDDLLKEAYSKGEEYVDPYRNNNQTSYTNNSGMPFGNVGGMGGMNPPINPIISNPNPMMQNNIPFTNPIIPTNINPNISMGIPSHMGLGNPNPNPNSFNPNAPYINPNISINMSQIPLNNNNVPPSDVPSSNSMYPGFNDDRLNNLPRPTINMIPGNNIPVYNPPYTGTNPTGNVNVNQSNPNPVPKNNYLDFFN